MRTKILLISLIWIAVVIVSIILAAIFGLSIERLINRKITWKDEPVELLIFKL